MLFISPRKVFSFSRYLNFRLDSYYRNGLIKKANFKFYDVTAWLTHILLIHILFNISRGRDNETMKFGQLIECNMRDIFLEKS